MAQDFYTNVPEVQQGYIGGAEVFNSNTCVVTLGAASDYTTPSGWRGVRIMVASSESTAVAPTTYNELKPTVTTSVGVAYGQAPGYPGHGNYLVTYSYYSPAVLDNRINLGTGKTLMLRGGWDYRIFTPLPVGATITVDYSHLTHTLEWLAVRVHRNANLSAQPFPPWEAAWATNGGYLYVDPSTDASPSAFWQGLIVGTHISSDPTDGMLLQGFIPGNITINQGASGNFIHSSGYVGYSHNNYTWRTARKMYMTSYRTAIHSYKLQTGTTDRPEGPLHSTRLIRM